MTSIKYMTSLLTFYLKGEIRTEKNFIQFKTPNTILGLIPLGAKTEKFTIDQISSTTTNFRLRLKYLIFGIFWLLIAVSCLSDSDTLAAGLICLLLGMPAVNGLAVATLVLALERYSRRSCPQKHTARD